MQREQQKRSTGSTEMQRAFSDGTNKGVDPDDETDAFM